LRINLRTNKERISKMILRIKIKGKGHRGTLRSRLKHKIMKYVTGGRI
jgi:hypothetical protein